MNMLTARRLLRASSALLLLAISTGARAWDCGRHLVNPGDGEGSVRKQCGRPDFVYVTSGVYRRGRFITVDEEWYYDFGPQRLVRRLHFHNAVLQDMDTPGYGMPGDGRRPCTPQDLRTGMTVYRLLSLCGYPLKRKDVSTHVGSHGDELVLVAQAWLYDFGSGYQPQKVIVEQGEVQDIVPASATRKR